MPASLPSFMDELTKLGGRSAVKFPEYNLDDDSVVKEIVSENLPSTPRRYLQTMALAAAAAPFMTVLSRRVGQMIHNRSVMRAASQASSGAKRRKILKEIRSGKIWGSGVGHKPGHEPLMTPAGLTSDLATGAVTGSVIQALRDKVDANQR